MELKVVENVRELSIRSAEYVLDHEQHCKDTVLVLPTGNTPLGMYHELVRVARFEKRDFSQYQLGQLDEYLGIPLDDRRNFFSWLEKVFIDPIGIKPENTIRINSSTDNPKDEIARVEREIRSRGGIGLAILGLGLNGHIGFNEPGSDFDSRSRAVDLSPETIESQTKYWGDGNVPSRAITLGLGTIAEARRILLLVSGKEKAEILYKTMCGPIREQVPASILRRLPQVTVIADKSAASRVLVDKDFTYDGANKVDSLSST